MSIEANGIGIDCPYLQRGKGSEVPGAVCKRTFPLQITRSGEGSKIRIQNSTSLQKICPLVDWGYANNRCQIIKEIPNGLEVPFYTVYKMPQKTG